MSREVVSKALRLQGNWEPWIFALGLAMLAVLMKPAYDRLVEKPYWEGKATAFRWRIVIGAVVAAITLGVLGAFRSEAFVNQTLISQLQQDAVTAESISEMSGLESQITELRQATVQSWYGFISFVLSGLIFAAAGAVCLGIGFRHGRDAWHRHFKRKRKSKKLREQKEALSGESETLHDRLTEKRAELRVLERRLEDHPSLDELREHVDTTEAELESLRKQRAKAREALYRHLYHNGYNIATTSYALQSYQSGGGDGAATPPRQEDSASRAPSSAQVVPSGSGAGGSRSGRSNTAGKGERPYVALRRAISRNNA